MGNSSECKKRTTKGRHWKQQRGKYLRKRKIWILWSHTIYNKINSLLLKINSKTKVGDNLGYIALLQFFF